MRCSCCTACLLSSALELLHAGRVSMAMRLLEQALRDAPHKPARTKAPARARKARAPA
jgi:hypothetical protein